MKTAKTSIEQVSPEKSTKHNPKLVQNFASSKTDRQTSKIRNFGWLVTGMVEACHQINAVDLNKVDLKIFTEIEPRTSQTTTILNCSQLSQTIQTERFMKKITNEIRIDTPKDLKNVGFFLLTMFAIAIWVIIYSLWFLAHTR